MQKFLMLDDGCFGSISYDECSTIFSGVFSRGLHSVIQYYADMALELCDKRLSAQGASMTAQVQLLRLVLPNQARDYLHKVMQATGSSRALAHYGQRQGYPWWQYSIQDRKAGCT